MFGQNCSSPALHSGHVPSEPTRQPTAARSPGLNLVTAGPTLVTRPTISWPGTQGGAGGVTPFPSLRAWARSVGSRLGIDVEANCDVALETEYAFALYMNLNLFYRLRPTCL